MDTDKKSDFLPYSSAPVRTRFAWRAGYLLAAFGIYMADQASKAWAVKTLRFGEERVVIRGFLQFIYTENPGGRRSRTLRQRVVQAPFFTSRSSSSTGSFVWPFSSKLVRPMAPSCSVARIAFAMAALSFVPAFWMAAMMMFVAS